MVIIIIVSFLLLLSLEPLEKYRINSNKQIVNNILLNLNLFSENYRLLLKEPILNEKQLQNISFKCDTFYKTADVLQSLWIYSMTGCNPKYLQAPGGTAFDNVREFYNNNNTIDTTGLNIKIIDLINKKEKNINE
jgi:type II secretory pathway pseudopilin PulG